MRLGEKTTVLNLREKHLEENTSQRTERLSHGDSFKNIYYVKHGKIQIQMLSASQSSGIKLK